MSTDQAAKTPRRIVFAGANIAFGASFIGLELLGFIYGVSPADPDLQASLGFMMVAINLLAGYAGGYLTAKRAGVNALQNGTLTGVLAYIVQQVVHAVLYGWGVVGDAFTALALIGGAIAGAVLYESQARSLARIRASGSALGGGDGGSPEGGEAPGGGGPGDPGEAPHEA